MKNLSIKKRTAALKVVPVRRRGILMMKMVTMMRVALLKMRRRTMVKSHTVTMIHRIWVKDRLHSFDVDADEESVEVYYDSSEDEHGNRILHI
jgi:hypothetical protein